MLTEEDIRQINENILGFKYSLIEYLDHTSLLSWVSLMSHKIAVGKPNVNFDNREFIQLPSGKKVRITINVEELE